MAESDDRLYRPNVGAMLFNREGLVFVGQRNDVNDIEKDSGSWQMPQGGIDEGEDPRRAVLRELKEETGTDKAEIVAETEGWFRYDIPSIVTGKLWHGKYKGQRQKWFALRFLGGDADIDIAAHDPPEFAGWKWANLDELSSLIVPFKRDVYAAVIRELGPAVRAATKRG
jgi:putative (di)nucleoside polyphosphate hydrolase